MTLKTQTEITIVAFLDTSNKVQLFLANSGTALQASDEVYDHFSKGTKDKEVTVTVVSTSDTVAVIPVSDSSDSWTWNNKPPVMSGTVKFYYAQGTCKMLSEGASETDVFNIKVGNYTADPTVVISRGGTSSNVVIGSGPKQG